MLLASTWSAAVRYLVVTALPTCGVCTTGSGDDFVVQQRVEAGAYAV